MYRKLIVIGMFGVLGGCASDTEFTCSYPDGVGCMSVTDVYKKSVNGELKEGKSHPIEEEDTFNDYEDSDYNAPPPKQKEVEGAAHPRGYQVAAYPFEVKPGNPIRRAPRILRVWINNWEDGQGDYHDSNHVYVVIDNGAWVFPENKHHTVKVIEENYFEEDVK